MTRNSIYIILSLLILPFTSCEYHDFEPSEWAIEPELNVSMTSIVHNSIEQIDTVVITTNYMDFNAECEATWCHVTTQRDSSWIIISLDPNTTTELRNTEVSVNIKRGEKSLSKEISVVQYGGEWTMIGQFPIFLAYKLNDTQMEILAEIINKLVFVKGSTFVMGSQNTDPTQPNYVPSALYLGVKPHLVTLSDYYIGSTEITQREWNAIMGSNDSSFKGANKPVDGLTWDKAMEFVSTLTALTRLNICLPTEAQWEFAARGGIYSKGSLYSGSDDWQEVANNIEPLEIDETDERYTTSNVAMLLPNELGLYDMSGNVAELCADWYSASYEYESNITNPVGAATGYFHVLRGGDFTVSDHVVSSYHRSWTRPNPNDFVSSSFSQFYGLRIVLNP